MPDAFCGRVPRSVLARHYTDFSPERLKRIYDGAGLRVLIKNPDSNNKRDVNIPPTAGPKNETEK
jgi:hypothetical protein